MTASDPFIVILRLRQQPKNPLLSVILTLSVSEGEESPYETLQLRLRVTKKGHPAPPSFSHPVPPFCHSER